MSQLRVVALPEAVAHEVRTTRRAPRYGHPVSEEVARSYGPCRLCLRFFRKGEEQRLLFTHDPFAEVDARSLPGPVFIHAEPCERYREDAGFPQHLLEHPLTLSAYGPERKLLAEELVTQGPIEPRLEALLRLSGARYVLVSDTSAGCFDVRVEPAAPLASRMV